MTPREIAKIHREDILYSVRALEKATSGKIHKYIHTEIIRGLREHLDENPWNKIESKKRLNDEIGKHRQSKRSIQNWLLILEKERLVTKDDHYQYYLTGMGKKLRIFPDIYGRMLLGSLVNIPWHETSEKNLAEFVRRAGLIILYLFIGNLRPTSDLSVPVTDELLNNGNLDWMKDAASIDIMFLMFQSRFLRTIVQDRNLQQFLYDERDYENLSTIFKKKFPKYYNVLEKAERRFSETFYKVSRGK